MPLVGNIECLPLDGIVDLNGGPIKVLKPSINYLTEQNSNRILSYKSNKHHNQMTQARAQTFWGAGAQTKKKGHPMPKKS